MPPPHGTILLPLEAALSTEPEHRCENIEAAANVRIHHLVPPPMTTLTANDQERRGFKLRPEVLSLGLTACVCYMRFCCSVVILIQPLFIALPLASSHSLAESKKTTKFS